MNADEQAWSEQQHGAAPAVSGLSFVPQGTLQDA